MENQISKLWVLLVLALAGCSSFSPDAGHEIVLIDKPIFFGHGGVEPEPVKAGRTFGAFTTDGVDVDVRPKKYEQVLPDTMTLDGVPITFHAILMLQVTDSVTLVKGFGEKWYENNLEQPFASLVRQAVRKRGMNETAISTTALDAIDGEIRDGLIAFIKEKALPIKLITMTVGRANPPDAIKNQRVETAAQEQRIQTEQQRKKAEDARLQAETSRAGAENAYREAMHLSPEQFIQLKMIEMQQSVCGEAKSTCTFIQNGAMPVYNLSK